MRLRITHKFIQLLGLAAVVALVSQAAMAGDINGHLYSPFNMPMSERSVVVNQDGNLTGYGQAATWAAAPVGWYGITNLPAGDYTMLLNEKDHFSRKILLGLQVPEKGKIEVVDRTEYSDFLGGLDWVQHRAVDFYQSFMATGTSINSVSVHQVYEPGPSVTVSVLENDPKGKQIGPSRTIPTSINNPSAAFWSAGEVPTIPGKIYCVHFHVKDGYQEFIGGARIRNANAYPDGHSWADDKMIDTPIDTVIQEDNDGIISTVDTKKSNSASEPLLYHSVSNLGQTFTAKGSSVLTVSCLVGNSGGTLIASVHDGVGAKGEGGPQIGPAKYIKTVDWNNKSAAVWKPGEVPITKGHVYYMKLRRPDGKDYVVYACAKDEYAGGNMYLDGKDSGTDLSTTIACEEHPGSLSVKKVGISDIAVTRGSTKTSISWKTSAACDSVIVDFGPQTPYSNRLSIKATGRGANNYVANLGVLPNTLYHYRITAKAHGMRDGRTSDMVFVTDPVAPNLVKNPGFETGSSSWTGFDEGGSLSARDFPADGDKVWFDGAKAHSGKTFFGGAANGAKCKGGVYQQISVTPGKPINASAWLWTWQDGRFGSLLKETVVGKIGIDPTGGTDPKSASIVWCNPVIAQDYFGDGSGVWTPIAVSATPTGKTATVFLQGGADASISWTVFGLDDVVASQEKTPKR